MVLSVKYLVLFTFELQTINLDYLIVKQTYALGITHNLFLNKYLIKYSKEYVYMKHYRKIYVFVADDICIGIRDYLRNCFRKYLFG